MFKHSLRTFVHYWLYSTINLLGLALSLTCVVIIARYVYSELTVDGFNSRLNRMYISTQSHHDRRYFTGAYDLRDIAEIPGIERHTSFIPFNNECIVFENQHYYVNLLAIDTAFLQIFDYPVTTGVANISRPGDAFLTETFAAKIFGNEDPLGKTLSYPGVNRILTVAGVIRMPSSKSLLSFDMLVNERLTPHWSHMPLSLVLLYTGVDYREINRQKSKFSDNCQLFPYREVYFDKHIHDPFGCLARGNAFYSFILSSIGILLLLTGIVNYINIHSVVMMRRNKEFSMKKVFGASDGSIFAQLYLENLLLIAVSIIIAFGFAGMIQPFIENVLGIRQYPSLRFDLRFATVLFATLPVAVSISPYLRYRYFSPVRSLRSVNAGSKPLFSRKFFICFQYIMTMGLIVVSLFFVKQLDFMLGKELGFRTQNIIKVTFLKNTGVTSYEVSEEIEKLEMRRKEITGILQQKLNECTLLENWSFGHFPVDRGRAYRFKTPGGELQNVTIIYTDKTQFELFGIQLLAGRSWNNEIDNFYTYNVIVSESALKQFGITDYSSGELQPEERLWKSHRPERAEEMKTVPSYRIVGVVKDIYPTHLSKQTHPVIFLFSEANSESPVIASFAPERRQDVIEFMRNLNDEFVGDEFSYTLIEDKIAALYREDKKIAVICAIFSGIAILISMLGLLGISLFDIRQRRKEIAIRKVNGAQIIDIIRLLLKKYLVLLGIAFVVAMPAASFAIHKYLENFAYKAPVSWWLFAVALVVTLAVSLLTLLYQTYKAGNENPADVV